MDAIGIFATRKAIVRTMIDAGGHVLLPTLTWKSVARINNGTQPRAAWYLWTVKLFLLAARNSNHWLLSKKTSPMSRYCGASGRRCSPAISMSTLLRTGLNSCGELYFGEDTFLFVKHKGQARQWCEHAPSPAFPLAPRILFQGPW